MNARGFCPESQERKKKKKTNKKKSIMGLCGKSTACYAEISFSLTDKVTSYDDYIELHKSYHGEPAPSTQRERERSSSRFDVPSERVAYPYV